MINTIRQQLEKIKAYHPTIKALFKASPYDSDANIRKSITEEIFVNELLANEAEIDAQIEKLDNSLDNIFTPNTIIFLSGYAGNGKTTFIKSFIRKKTKYEHIYIDVHEKRTNISTAIHKADDETLSIIKKIIREDVKNVKNCIAYLKSNKEILKDKLLISNALYSILKQNKDIDDEYCRELFESSDYKDTFSIFFIHFFLRFRPEDNKKYIIYFDNLDIAPMEYLSDMFFKFFGEAIRNANKISELPIMESKDIYLPRDFKFIFCLRDANEAFINQQIASRYDFRKEPFKLTFPTSYYKNIIDKRVDFIGKVYENADIEKYNLTVQEIKESFSALVNDDYFNDVFVPLFNKDYRETVAALLDTIIVYKLPHKREQLEYGVRGYLLFNLIKELLKDNFLKNYLTLSASREDGYCYLDRVLLTVLVNGSKYVRSDNGNDITSSYSVLSIIRDLDNFYSVEEILESLIRGFLYHTKNWVHLITIYNCSITEDNEKQFIKDLTGKYNLAIEKNDAKLFAEIDSLKLRINPSGFTHLRYILPHFEFYSNMAGNELPLLELKNRKNEQGEYFFEQTIDKVFRIVERHCDSMKLFFNNKYEKHGITPEVYYKSIYCFRHLGKSSIALDKGYFHSSRIISYHIDYIDYFRYDLINNFVQEVSEIQKINEALIKRLQKYISLLENSLDNRAISDFGGVLKTLVTKIINSDYKDTNTRIKTK